ncbi:MAG: cyclic nucleotide-binding domain-containing protein, partial [Spirochaetales bacterium]|nr:cyclic nucleotide-binding domain-containing protein [Spirochaetales bacterium]
VYIVARGEISSFDPLSPERGHVITPGHYFGERVTLFDQTSRFDFLVRTPSVCYMIGQKQFLMLVSASASFAMSLSNILRDKQGIFSAFEHFNAELMRSVNRGYADLRSLLKFYRGLHPALHPWVTGDRIDTGALLYAVRRLPENVTRNFAYLLTDDLPTEFRTPDDIFSAVASAARRRDIWEMLPGKSMVLLRSGMSDLVDFVTCLLVYANEAAKIRGRLHDPLSLKLIDAFIRENVQESLEACRDCRREFLEGLPFTREEVEGLLAVWPHDLVTRLSQILRHREVISLNFRRQVHTYHSLRFELWTHQIADAAKELLGCEPANLPEDIDVHIISSNSHSVTNCINPTFSTQGKKILAWARKREHPYLKESWSLESDLLYALGPEYFAAHNGVRAKDSAEIEYGVYRLSRTASTGIQVQLIDSAKLDYGHMDAGIGAAKHGKRKLIVNIDYAFGQQAEDIIQNLILLFGRNIKSINVMGKAGSLVGTRGDVLIADAFIEQTEDRFYPLKDYDDVSVEDLRLRLPGRGVYKGPILTVAGTLLQNSMMLKFYRNLWNCVGLEMEGTYYHRQILEATQLGVLREDLALRYVYYVSDLPMQAGQTLSQGLSAAEGLPPLYAITREILSRILS